MIGICRILVVVFFSPNREQRRTKKNYIDENKNIYWTDKHWNGMYLSLKHNCIYECDMVWLKHTCWVAHKFESRWNLNLKHNNLLYRNHAISMKYQRNITMFTYKLTTTIPLRGMLPLFPCKNVYDGSQRENETEATTNLFASNGWKCWKWALRLLWLVLMQ